MGREENGKIPMHRIPDRRRVDRDSECQGAIREIGEEREINRRCKEPKAKPSDMVSGGPMTVLLEAWENKDT